MAHSAPRPDQSGIGAAIGSKARTQQITRTARYEDAPGFYEPSRLWFYGNIRLLHGPLAAVTSALGPPDHSLGDLQDVEAEAEHFVLGAKVLVCGIHNPAHQRAALVPLRWGSPRILVLSGGFEYHLGAQLDQEPFRAARLWRYAWDPQTDLAVSRRAPSKLPTYARHNPTVDRLITQLAQGRCPGLRSPVDSLTPLLD